MRKLTFINSAKFHIVIKEITIHIFLWGLCKNSKAIHFWKTNKFYANTNMNEIFLFISLKYENVLWKVLYYIVFLAKHLIHIFVISRHQIIIPLQRVKFWNNRMEFNTNMIVYTIMMSHVKSKFLQKQNNFVRIMRNANEILWLLQLVNLCVYAL